MNTHRITLIAALAVTLLCCLPQPAMAYVGPGAGLSAIGALLAIVAGIIVALFGFVWYPFKRMLRKRKAADKQEGGSPG